MKRWMVCILFLIGCRLNDNSLRGSIGGDSQSPIPSPSTPSPLNLKFSGVPSDLSEDTLLNIDVTGNKLSGYFYKLGPINTTDCTLGTGYSDEVKKGTPISNDISNLDDTFLKICVVGKSTEGYVEDYSQASEAIWSKDANVLTVEFEQALVRLEEGDSAGGSFRINLSGIKPYDVTVNYEIEGDASDGVDYNLSSGSVVIPAGQTYTDVDYSLIENGDSDGERELRVLLSQSDKAKVTITDNYEYTAQIYDDDSGALPSATQVVASMYSTCALLDSGKIRCWGKNDFGQLGNNSTVDSLLPVDINSGLNFTYLAISNLKHACAITNTGALYCWGNNSSGQLGDNTTVDKHSPVLIDSGVSYQMVSLGNSFTCGITTGNVLKCWGRNFRSELGDGTSTDRHLPTIIDSGVSYMDIATGSESTCGITIGNVLKCWGRDTAGVLGNGANGDQTLPEIIDAGTPYSNVELGSASACAITTTNQLKCWGHNNYGLLGTGNNNTNESSPASIDVGVTYTNIYVGTYHSCGKTTDGSYKCWGRNQNGQFGVKTPNSANVPTPFFENFNIQSLAPNEYHTCLLLSNGSVACTGSNAYGQFGDGTIDINPTPIPIKVGTSFLKVDSGDSMACAIDNNNKLWCWGVGTIGDGGNSQRHFPQAIDPTGDYSNVSVGEVLSCAINTSGKLFCWGAGITEQALTTKQPVAIDPQETYSKVSAGQKHICAINTTGVLKCWGKGDWGSLGLGIFSGYFSQPQIVDSGTSYTDVSAGAEYTCAVTTGNVLKCWGYNNNGQLGEGTTGNKTSPVVIDSGVSYQSVATTLPLSNNSSCGILTSGALKCWGKNYTHKFGNGNTTDSLTPITGDSGNNYKSITVGGHHACGIRTDDSLRCWGQNNYGQVGNGVTVGSLNVELSDGGTLYAQVSSGREFTCGVTLTGALKCWGINSRAQIGNGARRGVPTLTRDLLIP